jgi:hypothetical protein
MVGRAKFVVIMGSLLLPYISAAPLDPPTSEGEYVTENMWPVLANNPDGKGMVADVIKHGFDNLKTEPAFQEKFREVVIEPLKPDRSHATQMGYVRETFDLIDDKLKKAVEGPKGNKDDDDECLIC